MITACAVERPDSFTVSLIVDGVDTAGRGLSVESGVDVLAPVEGVGEFLGAGVELGGHVLLRGQLSTVLPIACRVEGVSNLEGGLRVLDVLVAGGELAGLSLALLDLALRVLDLIVDLRVELSLFAHLLQSLVLVSLLRIFQGQLTVALFCSRGQRRNEGVLQFACRGGFRRT